MHRYFLNLREREERHETAFNIALSPIINALRYLPLPLGIAEAGNCAVWTSEGLKRAGVVLNGSLWPKSIFIHIFENAPLTAIGSHENVSVVSYRRIKHAHRSYGTNTDGLEGVAPLQSLRSLAYRDLEWFADAIVEVPDGTIEATVTRQEHPLQPSAVRNLTNNNGVIAVSVLFGFFVARRYSRGFTKGIVPRKYWPSRWKGD